MGKKLNNLRSVAILTLLFIFISNPVLTLADNLSEVQKNDVRMQVSDRLRQLTSNSVSYSDERGAVYCLMNMMNVGMWYEFASNNTDVKFSNPELNSYRDYLDQALDKFNASYGSESDGLSHPAKVEFDKGSKGSAVEHASYSKGYVNAVSKTMHDYYEELYKSIQDELDKKDSDDAKQDYLKDPTVGSIAKAVYRSCQRVSEEKGDIVSLTNFYNGNNTTVWKYDRDISDAISASNNDDYTLIIKRAQELIDNDILISESESPMEGDTAWDRYLDEIDGKYQVNEHFLKVFACSATYIPFQSKVGEASFMTSLTNLDKDALTKDTYTSICNRKKPLYYVKTDERDDEGYLQNTANRITVKEFIDSISDNESGVLVAPTGGFQKSKDGDSFVVSHNAGVNRYDDNGEVVASDTPASTTTPKEGVDEGNDPDETYLGDNISDTTKLSKTIYSYGKDIGTRNAIINTVVLYNFLRDNKSIESIPNLTKRFLYVNPFGDIVLDDNTIVIPAASNANYYSTAEGTVYNPCTAAFMNYYPKSSITSEYFSVSNRDAGKYVIAMSGALSADSNNDVNQDGDENGDGTDDSKDDKSTWEKVKDGASSVWNSAKRGVEHVTGTIKSLVSNGNEGTAEDCFSQNTIGPLEDSDVESSAYIIGEDKQSLNALRSGDYCMPIEMKMYNEGNDKLSILRAFNYKYKATIKGLTSMASSTFNNNYLVVPDNQTLSDFGSPDCLFPLTGSQSSDVYISKCKFLASKMYDSMCIGAGGDYAGLNQRYERDYLTSIFEEGYNGDANIAAFVKSSMDEYDSNLESNSFTNTIKSICQKVVSTLGTTTGAVGLKNSYEDPIFGRFLYVAKGFIGIFFLIVGVVFLIKFNRRHANWFYCTTGVAFSVLLTYLLLEVIPLYLPIFLNGVINNVSDNIGYKTLDMKLEQYKNVDDSSDPNGVGTSSFNVYRLNDSQIDELSSQFKVSKENLVAGSRYIIDNESGLFVQGDCLKVDIDKFMATCSITGNHQGVGLNAIYQVSCHKYVSNNTDYYFPYYSVVDSFISKLNKFEQLYNIPPSQLTYKSMKKDSFLISNYIQSDLFLNGDDMSKLEEQFGTELYQKAIDNSMFGSNNIDFLGLSDVFVKLPSQDFDAVKDTLWFKTMQRQGYYDETGTVIDDDKMGKLIERVNRSVKQFLIRNNSEISFISDENIIKTTCLYACTEINREISYFDDCVYPQSLNYEEIKLSDVYLTVLTKDYDRYVAANQDISDYVNSEFKTPGMVMLSVVIFEGWLIVEIMNIGMPILYIALLGCSIIRIVGKQNSEIKMVFKGYLKVFGMISVCYFLFCLLTAKVASIDSLVLSMVILIFFYSVFLAIMMSVLSALIMSCFDFGSARVNSCLKDVAKKLHLPNGVDQIRQAIQSIRNRRNTDDESSGYNRNFNDYKKYSYKSSVEDLYGDELDAQILERRHPGFIDKYGSGDRSTYRERNRIRKGKTKKIYQEIDDLDDEDRFKY